jgi:acetolactate synthase I/II/III large subunit
MNGAEALVATSVKNGIEICFANPGTTEMSLVLAFDAVPGVRGVLCLNENVATGAADGYGRMAGKPAMCIMHLGPGLANGLTNLHNARRAATPILNIIGEHATLHSPADWRLASDIEVVARYASGFVR